MRLLSFPILFLGFAAPAAADIYPIEEGDVFCIGYDKTTNSCASVQTVKVLENGEFLILDLAGFAFGETRLDMVATMEAFENDGKICVKPGGIKTLMTPKEAALAEGWQNMIQYQLDEMAEEGYCFEHKRCDDEWVAIAHVAEEIRRDLSATFQVFKTDDPRSNTVQPRYLGMEDLNFMQKKVEEKCFPKDT